VSWPNVRFPPHHVGPHPPEAFLLRVAASTNLRVFLLSTTLTNLTSPTTSRSPEVPASRYYILPTDPLISRALRIGLRCQCNVQRIFVEPRNPAISVPRLSFSSPNLPRVSELLDSTPLGGQLLKKRRNLFALLHTCKIRHYGYNIYYNSWYATA
jgi:hypothetical protein